MVLDVSNNHIERMEGVEWSNISRLEVLMIGGNDFREIPADIIANKRLKRLGIDWIKYTIKGNANANTVIKGNANSNNKDEVMD